MTTTDSSAIPADSSVTACILAGGRGTRLRSVLSDRPKPLAEVGGRPFVTRLLDQVVAAGVGPAVLCTGYLADLVEATLGASYSGLELLYSRESEALGTAGALGLALPLVHSATVLVLNGDSYCDVDLAAQLEDHRRSGARATIALVEVEDAGRYGRVRIDPEGWVESFEEKAASIGAGLINAGIYVLRREVIEAIPAGRPVSIEREIFPALAGAGLRGFETHGRFLDIGTPASLARATAFFEEAGR